MKRLLLLAAVVSAGCAMAPSPQMVDGADAGQKPDTDAFIREYLAKTAIDPDSVKVLSVSEPTKCGKYTASYKPVFGWCVTYSFNAKNRFGGYVGATSHNAMIRNGKIVWEDGAFTEFRF